MMLNKQKVIHKLNNMSIANQVSIQVKKLQKQDMKQETFPIFIHTQDNRQKTIDAEQFMCYFLNIDQPTILEKHFKTIHQHIVLLAKTQQYPYCAESLLQSLCNLFKISPSIQIIGLIRAAINTDVKFEATNRHTDDVLNNQQNIRNMIDSNVPIALPYGPNLPPVIALHNHEEMSDVCDQRKQGDSNKIYEQDNERVSQFIQSPFKTVKRVGISQIFTNLVNVTCCQLIGEWFPQSLPNISPTILVELLKLLQYIAPSMYTFYLLSIIQQLIKSIILMLENKDNEKKLNKEHVEAITALISNITERWGYNNPEFNREMIQWELDQRIILLFIRSKVAQKKLHAAKLLSEICRKCNQQSIKVSVQSIKAFMNNHNLLQEIYSTDSHPQILIKAHEIFNFATKQEGLTHHLINVIFNLLQKYSQNVTKSLFSTMIGTGHKNLQNNRQYILQKISQLPRANCYNEETFQLIETLMIITPSEQIQKSLRVLYNIIQRNNDKFKPSLRNKAITIYFEVFIMGVESDVFHQDNSIAILKPILNNPKSPLFLCMIQNFIYKLKDQFSRQSGIKCKKALNSTIKKLLIEQKVHKLQLQDQQKHLAILRLLLQNYQQLDRQLLTQEQLWNLIKADRQFSKFLHHYSSQTQIHLISSLITIQNQSIRDLQCVVDIYQTMQPQVKQIIAPLLVDKYYSSTNILIKYLLAEHVIKIAPISFTEMVEQLQTWADDVGRCLSLLILMRQTLGKQDQKGFDEYPPYQFIKNSYFIQVKIINVEVFDSQTYQIIVKNYSSLYEIVQICLEMIKLPFDKVRIRLNDQNISLNQLKYQIGSLTSLRFVSLFFDQTAQCQWFDKDKLFDKTGALNNQVIAILKQIFYKYSSKDGKLRPNKVISIFEKATNTSPISQHDSRVLTLYNNYSNNGQYLTIEQWINFYYQSSLKNAHLIIDNLRNLGYKQYFQNKQNYSQYLNSSNQLRKYIVKDNRLYDVLFKIYERSQNAKKEDAKIMESQLMSMLRLLPVSQSIVSWVTDLNSEIAQVCKQNSLFDWYLSGIIESIYTTNMKIQDYNKWKQQFIKSKLYHHCFKMFIKYLSMILGKEQLEIQVNSNIQIFVLEYLAEILRDNFKIPSLLLVDQCESKNVIVANTQNIKLAAVEHCQHFSINRMGQLCISIIKGKRSVKMAQNILALTLVIPIKQSKQQHFQVSQFLIFHELQPIRQIFNTFYFLLSSNHPAIIQCYYSLPTSKRYGQTGIISQHCKQYFSILSKMLFLQVDEEESMAKHLLKVYQEDINYEVDAMSGVGSIQVQESLLGKFKIIKELHIYNPKFQILSATIESIKYLLQNCPEESLRQILYTISSSLCSVEYNLSFMQKIMNKIQLSRNSIHRGSKKVGIMNLGCICYINAALQQLQQIDTFRNGIISTQVKGEDIDFFTQFQKIIYQLTYGQRIFIIPQNFCLNYLDYNNQPINIKEQHDADQFLNQLFDRLQFRLKHTNQKDLIGNNFKGEMFNIIQCQSCFNTKEKIQNFYILSVQIKNQNTLKDCLNKLIEPEIICDYNCQFCGGKVQTIQKYHRFHILPPFLFIHLQRLVFDLQTFTKIKLDHPVEFPIEIELQTYFKDAASEQTYILKGFVVHQGTSEGGHYYSIIKCGSEWIKFDDVRIDVWNWESGASDRNNAYMLIYEIKKNRQIHSNQQQSIGNVIAMQQIKADTEHLMKQKIFLQTSFLQFMVTTFKKMPIPQQFKPTNITTPYLPNYADIPLHLQQILDTGYEVIIKYLCVQSEVRSLNILGNNWNISEAKDNDQYSNKNNSQVSFLVMNLMQILHDRPHLAVKMLYDYLLDENKQLFGIIYLHKQKYIRQVFCCIIVKVFDILASYSHIDFLVPVPDNQHVVKLMQKMMSALLQVGKNYNKMSQFFKLLHKMTQDDQRAATWFQRNKLGPKLIHMILQSESNMRDLLPQYPFYLNNNNRKSDVIDSILQTIRCLLPHQPSLSLQCQQLTLQRKAYTNIQLYRKLLNDRYDNPSIPNMLAYAITNNIQFNNKVITYVVQNINRFNHQDQFIVQYIKIMFSILSVDDTLSRERCQRLLGVPILMRIGEKEGEEYLAVRNNDRICRYWNPVLKGGDQFMLSFLELLYSNRNQLSYFTLLGIMAVLNLISSNKKVAEYIRQLPGPTLQHSRYILWINTFMYECNSIHNDNNRDVPPQKRKQYLQQIAKLLRQVQISEQKPQLTEQLQLKQRQLQQNNINAAFKVGKILYTSGWLAIDFAVGLNLFLSADVVLPDTVNICEDVICAKFNVLYGIVQGQQGQLAQVIQYNIQVHQKTQIQFTQTYNYKFILEPGTHQFSLPFAQTQPQVIQAVLLSAIIPKQTNNKPVIRRQIIQVQQLPILSNQAIVEEQQFPSLLGQQMKDEDGCNGKKMEQGGQLLQCPFCGKISGQFANRCPHCGEDWGVMMY